MQTLTNVTPSALLASNTTVYGCVTVTNTGETFLLNEDQVEIEMLGDCHSSGPLTVANLDYLSACDLTWGQCELEPEECSVVITHKGVDYVCNTLEEFKTQLALVVKQYAN